MAEGIRIGGGGKKSGAYVWKKYEYTPEKTHIFENPSFRGTYINSKVMQLDNANFDVSLLSNDNIFAFLDQFSVNGSYPKFTYTNNTLHYWYQSTAEWQGETYEPSTRQLTLGGGVSSSNTFSFTGIKTITEEAIIGDFLDFIVSDDPTAYPDGGEQGGYWYEKVVEGIDLTGIFGCTKMAVDKLTFTTATSASKAVNHSLNEVPKVAIVLSNNSIAADSNNRVILSAGFNLYGFTTITAATIKIDLSSSNHIGSFTSNFANTNWSTTQINLTGGSYESGIEYTLITMA